MSLSPIALSNTLLECCYGSGNIEVRNSVARTVRRVYFYFGLPKKLRIIKPRLVGSGEGYGGGADTCRIGLAGNTYGID